MQRNRKIRKIEEPRNQKQQPQNMRMVKSFEPMFENSANSRAITKVKVAPHVSNQNGQKVTLGHTPQKLAKVEPIWNGETVYIIGGGPSLKDFKWEWLLGKKTIAINKAFYSYPQADILYWTDGRFYNWYKDDIDNFKGKKYTITPTYPGIAQDINVLKRGQKLGLEKERDTLSHGNNGGYAAINLAFHLGAKRIVLLGYDMGNNGTISHFHEGYPTHTTGDQIYKSQFIPAIESLGPLLKNAGIEVYNASMVSKLGVFPKITFEKAISFR